MSLILSSASRIAGGRSTRSLGRAAEVVCPYSRGEAGFGLRLLLGELDGPPEPDIERAWIAEAKRRHQELLEGRVKDIPAEQVFARVRELGRRRILVAWSALFGALVVAPFTAGAQRTERIHRIGYVIPQSRSTRNEAFVQALQELGYVEGRNVPIEMRFAEGRPERLPGLVEEVIRAGIDVLVMGATIGARAAKNATSTIPIVFAASSSAAAARRAFS
jgi:hypothetical protein